MVTPAAAPRFVAAASLATETTTTRSPRRAANAGRWQPMAVADWYAPWLSWPMVMSRTLLDMQQAQLGAWVEWQRSCWALGQEGWDAWRAHFAGGAPFDA